MPVLQVLPVALKARQGGVAVQLLRRLEAESAVRPWALLSRERRAYRLEMVHGRQAWAEMIEAAPAPPPTTLEDPAFEDVVTRAQRAVGASAIHFEGLAGLPLRSVARLGGEARLVFSIHDFALFCARPHLAQRPDDRFCGYCTDLSRCQLCLQESWSVPAGFQGDYRAAARAALDRATALVFPSRYLQAQHAELFAIAPGVVQRVIPPAAAPATARAAGAATADPRHLALVGAVHTHKGAAVFEDLVYRLRAAGRDDLRFSVWGGGDPAWLRRLRLLPGVDVRGYYRAGSLSARLRQHGVGLALLLSIVPEAYGLTLDECLIAGVPAIAFDHGAMAERIRERGGGRLVPLAQGAAGVAETIRELVDGGAAADLAKEAARFVPPDVSAAAQAYRTLYAELGLG
jgi:glycosyltransferase involved in cell wall biosynthesis